MLALAARAAAPAQAQDAAAAPALNWVRVGGAESCMAARELADRIETRVGRVLFVPATEALLSVDGYVTEPEPGRFVAVIEVTRPDGQVIGRRKLEARGESCRVLDEAISLVIEVTLYPDSQLVGPGIPLDRHTQEALHALFGAESADPDLKQLPVPEVRGAPEPALAPATAAPPRVSAPPESPQWRVAIDAGAASSLGSLPGVGFGGGAHLSVTPPDMWPIVLGGHLWSTARADVGGSAQADARFELAHVYLGACPGVLSWAADARICGALELGSLRVTPRGFEISAGAQQHLAVHALVGGLLRPAVSGVFHLRLGLWLGLPLIQRRFRFQALDGSSQDLFQTPQAGLRGEIGAGVAF